jgi:hypothetical protein
MAKRMKIDKAVLHVFANVAVRIEISSDGRLILHTQRMKPISSDEE